MSGNARAKSMLNRRMSMYDRRMSMYDCRMSMYDCRMSMYDYRMSMYARRMWMCDHRMWMYACRMCAVEGVLHIRSLLEEGRLRPQNVDVWSPEANMREKGGVGLEYSSVWNCGMVD